MILSNDNRHRLRPNMDSRPEWVDVWIDDMPEFIREPRFLDNAVDDDL